MKATLPNIIKVTPHAQGKPNTLPKIHLCRTESELKRLYKLIRYPLYMNLLWVENYFEKIIINVTFP